MTKAELKNLEKGIEKLSHSELLELVEKLIHRIRTGNGAEKNLDWNDLYGSAKGLWGRDAQEYISDIRTER